MSRPSFINRSLAFLLMMAGCASPQSSSMQLPPVSGGQSTQFKSERWLAYYDKKTPTEFFKDYDLVVFDFDHHPEFQSLQPRTEVLSYLSLGEEHGHSPNVNDLKVAGVVMTVNAEWQSYVIDPRSNEWRTIILDKKLPAIIAAGFDGIMIDTINSPLVFVESSAADKQAIYNATVRLVRDIRTRYPNMKIMVNRGFEFTGDIANYIDYQLVESSFSKFDKKTQKFSIWDHPAQRPIVQSIRKAQQKNPQLKIYTLDYWDMNDVEGVKFIYKVQRLRGFHPYVASSDLRTTYENPALAHFEP